MTAALALTRYRRADTAEMPRLDDPHAVIQVTLSELVRAAEVLAAAEAQDRPGPDHHVNRALGALYILQSSLDFEKGGDIADDLFRIYEFCRQQILRHRARDGAPELAAAAKALRDILGAWQEIGARP